MHASGPLSSLVCCAALALDAAGPFQPEHLKPPVLFYFPDLLVYMHWFVIDIKMNLDFGGAACLLVALYVC